MQRPSHELVYIVSTVKRLVEARIAFVFTDRHACANAALAFDDPSELGRIDWQILQQSDFRRDNADPGKLERYEAELLVRSHMPVEAMAGIVCFDSATRDNLIALARAAGCNVRVTATPEVYFG